MRAQRGAIVAQKKDERVVAEILFPEQIEDASDAVVDRGHHGQGGAPPLRHLPGKTGQILLRRDQGHMRCVVTHEKEERRGAVLPAQEGKGRLGLLVQAVVLRRVIFPRGVERISLEVEVAKIAIQLTPVKVAEAARAGTVGQLQLPGHFGAVRTLHFQRGILPLRPGQHRPVGFQVPLARHAGDIACGLQTLRERDLLQRQGSVLVRIETEALLIASGQQTRTRRRALRCGDVAVGEKRTLAGQTVEVRCLHIVADTVRTEVGVALVVGEDDDEVRAVFRADDVRCTEPRAERKEQRAHRFHVQKFSPPSCSTNLESLSCSAVTCPI